MKSEVDTTEAAKSIVTLYTGANAPSDEDNQLSFLWDERSRMYSIALSEFIEDVMERLEIPINQRSSARVGLNRCLTDRENYGIVTCFMGDVEDYLFELTQGEQYSCF